MRNTLLHRKDRPPGAESLTDGCEGAALLCGQGLGGLQPTAGPALGTAFLINFGLIGAP